MKKKIKITLSIIGGIFGSIFLLVIGSLMIFLVGIALLIFMPRTVQYITVQNINRNSNFEYELLEKVNSPEYFKDSIIITGFGIYEVINNKYITENQLNEEYHSCRVSSWPYFFSFNDRITQIECSVSGIELFGVGVHDTKEEWKKALEKKGFKLIGDYNQFLRYEKNNVRIQFSLNNEKDVRSYTIYIDPPVFITKVIYELLENMKVY